MAKPGALLLLLAVAASQVDLHLSVYVNGTEEVDISDCPITFYGRKASVMHVSFRNSSAVICFKKNSSEPAQDCVFVTQGNRTTAMNVTSVNVTTTTGSQVHRALPSITSNSTCNIHIMAKDRQLSSFRMTFYNFGPQTALQIERESIYALDNITVDAVVRNSSQGSWMFNGSRGIKYHMELSGCRHGGGVMAPNTTRTHPASCSVTTCNARAVIQSDSKCGRLQVCQGNNTCLQTTVVCSVTGSNVIDFAGRIHSVPDRCVYTLAKGSPKLDFELLGAFRERRRRDVPFLDHLILLLNQSNDKIILEQGGRIRIGRSIVNFNAGPQRVHGVLITKDQTGVTIKTPFSDTTIFFDGNTATIEGPVVSVHGLCGNPDNKAQRPIVNASHSSLHSPPSCKIQYNDTADSMINCNRSTEHCNLLRQPPFTACHSDISPEPYISSCINTLCQYPAVDGLRCQLLEAYAKSCSMKHNITLNGWRSKAGCHFPQAFCRDRYCSDHEFCGGIRSGEPRCLCRAIFASNYTATGALGEPTVCMQNSATLTLAGCLLEGKGINYTVLHLNDQNCTGSMDNETHMLTFRYDTSDTCGSEISMNNSQIIYKNSVLSRNTSGDLITRHDQVNLEFSCYYPKPDIKSVAFKIKSGSVMLQVVSGIWNYSLTMNAYTDPGRKQLVRPNTEILLNQKVWMELKTDRLDDRVIAVITDSCWATDRPSANGSLRYDLIINGCPNPIDQTVKVEGNGLGTSNFFSFNMFEFSGKSREIYLHCQLELCVKKGNSCAPRCGGGGGRRRRSYRKRTDGKATLITMSWSY